MNGYERRYTNDAPLRKSETIFSNVNNIQSMIQEVQIKVRTTFNEMNSIIKHVALGALFRSLPVLERGTHFYLWSRRHQNQMLESCHHHQMAPRFLPVLK